MAEADLVTFLVPCPWHLPVLPTGWALSSHVLGGELTLLAKGDGVGMWPKLSWLESVLGFLR